MVYPPWLPKFIVLPTISATPAIWAIQNLPGHPVYFLNLGKIFHYFDKIIFGFEFDLDRISFSSEFGFVRIGNFLNLNSVRSGCSETESNFVKLTVNIFTLQTRRFRGLSFAQDLRLPEPFIQYRFSLTAE